MKRLVVGVGVLALTCLWAAPGDPCHVGPRRHVVDPEAAADTIPPPALRLEVESIVRGHGPDPVTHSSVSTDDYGTIVCRVESLVDDQSAPDEMGIRLIGLGGLMPKGGLPLPDYDVSPWGNATDGWMLFIDWIDGARDEQEPIEFAIAAFAVDAAGNVSVTADTIEVTDPGR